MGPIRKAVLLAASATALLLAGAGVASADSGAYGGAYNSPGVLSGNVVQVPIDVPINACGNSLNVIGLLNPSFGNDCSNGGGQEGGYGDGYHHGGSYNNGGSYNGGAYNGGQGSGWEHHGWGKQDSRWSGDSQDCAGH